MMFNCKILDFFNPEKGLLRNSALYDEIIPFVKWGNIILPIW